MRGHAGFWFPVVLLLLLLLAALRSAHAEDGYFVDGGKLVLRPFVSVPITNVLWKHNGNLVAEWVENSVELTYYGTFKTRTTLDLKTGRLEIKDTSRADMGKYTLEINNVVQKQVYDVIAIKKVPKPVVLLRPLTCTPESDSCTLSCGEDASEADPITYSWKEGNGLWNELEKDMEINKNATAHVETFSCKMKNPVNEEDSEPYDNPFFQKKEHSSSIGWVVVTFGVVVVGLIAGAAFWKRNNIKAWFSKSSDGNGEGSASPPADDKPSENEMLAPKTTDVDA